ncbi:hypothetical protein HJFPF1_13616 [Paramyrothecium foliicola]|nr:hypothetical protein HJFPF1_13616 [Paramyrothecium foliicola]
MPQNFASACQEAAIAAYNIPHKKPNPSGITRTNPASPGWDTETAQIFFKAGLQAFVAYYLTWRGVYGRRVQLDFQRCFDRFHECSPEAQSKAASELVGVACSKEVRYELLYIAERLCTRKFRRDPKFRRVPRQHESILSSLARPPCALQPELSLQPPLLAPGAVTGSRRMFHTNAPVASLSSIFPLSARDIILQANGTAGLSMCSSWDRDSPIHALMTFDVVDHALPDLYKSLFCGAEVALDEQSCVRRGNTWWISGAIPSAIDKIFGSVISQALEASPKRQCEVVAGKALAQGVCMCFTDNFDSGHMSLDMEESLAWSIVLKLWYPDVIAWEPESR